MKNSLIPFYKQHNRYITKAEGCYFYDHKNTALLDLESGDWAANLGHSHKDILSVLSKQASISVHDGLLFRNQLSEKLSLVLSDIMGIREGKAAFLNSGSEAVNLGITIAMNLTGRKKVLKLDCSFLSSYGYGKISADNSTLINIPLNDFDAIETIDYSEIAAFVFEAGSAWGTVQFPQNDFIEKLAIKAKQNGCMLMANEVTSGFGRTGKWFGYQHYDYHPDIISIGKALGNGYPVSGVVVNNEVAQLFNENPFRYAQSHQNDPLGCAIGLEVIRVLANNNLITKSAEEGGYFKYKLNELCEKIPHMIKQVRGKGMMIAMEMASAEVASNLWNNLLYNNIICGVKDEVIRFMPPLIIEIKTLDFVLETITELLKE